MDTQIAQLIDLVKSLHEKVDILSEENKELRRIIEKRPEQQQIPVPVLPPKRVQSEKEQCCGITAKGTRCKNKVVENEKCKMHLNQDTRQVAPKVKKVKKTKPVAPMHNHAPGVFGEYCQLCETHGDIIDPRLPDRQFEIISTGTTQEMEMEPIIEEEEEMEDRELLNTLAGLGLSTSNNWADDDDDDDDFFEK